MESHTKDYNTPQADFLNIVEGVLGPQFNEAGAQIWWCEEFDNDLGFQVTDGNHAYFYDVAPDNYAGIKRIWFRPDGLVDQISIHPFRSLEEDRINNRVVVGW